MALIPNTDRNLMSMMMRNLSVSPELKGRDNIPLLVEAKK
jgi:hypothetical protein